MNLCTIIGARPQFIKASAITREIESYNKSHSEKIINTIIHTGQHCDANMSDVFFKELSIPIPSYNLGVSGLSHGAMTGRMIEKIEYILLKLMPDFTVVFGDTNSTLAGALASSKINIPVVHIEAGLRSFNTKMPEEINRVLTDNLSQKLFCPTETGVKNLNNEGIVNGVYNFGDVMLDVTRHYEEKAKGIIDLSTWDLSEKEYTIFTIHRPENTKDKLKLKSILEAVNEISQETKIILPLHPGSYKQIKSFNLDHLLTNFRILEPVSYLEMLRLLMSSKVVLTDSGGIQKEAFFLDVPVITLRDETEWEETLINKRNTLTGANKNKILDAWNIVKNLIIQNESFSPFGCGDAAIKILHKIQQ